MIVTDAGRDAVDAAAFCARRDCRAGWRKACERSTARGREMLLRTAKSCGPDAPTLASSSRMASRPNRARTRHTSADDGGKRARSPGRARRKPLKPLRAGMPGDSGVLVYSCAFYPFKVHTRPRVQRASGVPHALFGRKIQVKPRAHRAARTKSYPTLYQRHCEEHLRRSNPHFLCVEMDCFACARNDGATRHILSRHRPRKRAIQYSEVSMMESKGRSVLDPPHAR